MRNTSNPSTRHRLLAAGAAVTFTSLGVVALAAPAQAADANSKVWVCKYVRTPGGDEVLKDGKNPIEVSGTSVDGNKDGQVFVGDQFADAQDSSVSVIVQIEGADPGSGACQPTPPSVVTPTTPSTGKPTTPGGSVTPGTIAPGTGGEGTAGSLPVGLVGGGVLLVGAALLAAEAERRRRGASRP